MRTSRVLLTVVVVEVVVVVAAVEVEVVAVAVVEMESYKAIHRFAKRCPMQRRPEVKDWRCFRLLRV